MAFNVGAGKDLDIMIKVTVEKYYEFDSTTQDAKEYGITTPQQMAAKDKYELSETITDLHDVLRYTDDEYEVRFEVVELGAWNEIIEPEMGGYVLVKRKSTKHVDEVHTTLYQRQLGRTPADAPYEYYQNVEKPYTQGVIWEDILAAKGRGCEIIVLEPKRNLHERVIYTAPEQTTSMQLEPEQE